MKAENDERRTRCSAGFTLIEVLLVVAILSILAAVVVVNVSGKRKGAMIGATRASIKGIGNAIDLYEVDTGRYPPSIDSLLKDDGAPNWSGPYIRGVAVDPWGTAFSYKATGESTYEIRSAGPDQQLGNDDDITN